MCKLRVNNLKVFEHLFNYSRTEYCLNVHLKIYAVLKLIYSKPEIKGHVNGADCDHIAYHDPKEGMEQY